MRWRMALAGLAGRLSDRRGSRAGHLEKKSRQRQRAHARARADADAGRPPPPPRQRAPPHFSVFYFCPRRTRKKASAFTPHTSGEHLSAARRCFYNCIQAAVLHSSSSRCRVGQRRVHLVDLAQHARPERRRRGGRQQLLQLRERRRADDGARDERAAQHKPGCCLRFVWVCVCLCVLWRHGSCKVLRLWALRAKGGRSNGSSSAPNTKPPDAPVRTAPNRAAHTSARAPPATARGAPRSRSTRAPPRRRAGARRSATRPRRSGRGSG